VQAIPKAEDFYDDIINSYLEIAIYYLQREVFITSGDGSKINDNYTTRLKEFLVKNRLAGDNTPIKLAA
jgi:hypothetical protein